MISVPEKVVFHVVSPLGPLAGKGGTVDLPVTDVPVFNQTGKPLVLHDVRISGTWRADTGVSVPAALAADADTRTLEPGETGQIHISGTVAANPALYRASLQIGMPSGDPFIMPVEIGVEAHWMWGFALVLAGLLTVGGLNTLDREQKVQASRKRLLEKQRAAEFAALDIPVQSLFARRLDTMRAEYARAVEALATPNWLSFVDHRLDDSEGHTKAADEQLAQILQGWAVSPSTGGPLTAAVEEQLEALHARIDATRVRYAAAPPAGETLFDRLARFDAWSAGRLTATFDASWRDLAADLERLRLLNSAGRAPEARASAVAMSRRARRTAAFVSDAMTLLDKFASLSRADISREARLRTRLQNPMLPDPDRLNLAGSLESEIARFGPNFDWPMRRALSSGLQNLETRSLQALATAIKARAAATGAATAIAGFFIPPSVTAAQEAGAQVRLGPDGKLEPEAKFAWLGRVVQTWRSEIAQEPAAAPGVLQAVETLDAAVRSRDIEAISAATRAIIDAWSTMREAHAFDQINAICAVFVMEQRAAMLDELLASEQKLRFLGAHPQAAGWESELAALRTRLTDLTVQPYVPGAHNDPFNDISQVADRLYKLDMTIDHALWDTENLPKAAKLWLAAELGAAGSNLQDLRNFLSEYRDLTVTPNVGRPGPLETGDEVFFTLGNLDAGWQEGVNLTIRFGDDQSQTITAEAWRQGAKLSHIYARPGSYVVEVLARPAAPVAGGEEEPSIGGVREPIVLEPSKVAQAGQVADALFNIRFLLTLMIAAGGYYWFYYAKFSAFGASPSDYVQAFALGFAVSLAVNKLPEALAKFVPLG
jgi:hypothetical protein